MDICFDCFSGVSGDMLVGALLGLGASDKYLRVCLNSLNIDSFETYINKFNKNGYLVTDFNVVLKSDNHDHDTSYIFGKEKFEEIKQKRNIDAIKNIINSSRLSLKAKNLSIKIFEIIARAEAKAHKVPINEVVFHENGAMDSIVDIVSFAVCIDNLNVENVYVKNLCEGKGFINTRVGLLSIPSPAVKNIASEFNISIKSIDCPYELITPTGLASLCAIASFESINKCSTKVAYGNGKREYNLPCVLKVEAY